MWVSSVGRLQVGVGLWDVGTGLIMSVAFAVAIGLIACERGLATRGGAVEIVTTQSPAA